MRRAAAAAAAGSFLSIGPLAFSKCPRAGIDLEAVARVDGLVYAERSPIAEVAAARGVIERDTHDRDSRAAGAGPEIDRRPGDLGRHMAHDRAIREIGRIV